MAIVTLNEKVFGQRVVNGTTWPWVYQLQRVENESKSKVRWQIIALNNGACDYLIGTWRTLREAREKFRSLSGDDV